jgi:nucleoporin GLE1
MKSEWAKRRRQITPKIGQLTDSREQINDIVGLFRNPLIERNSIIIIIPSQSNQLLQIIRLPQGYPPQIYNALLSSLAKAILLQAETEVTAEKKSAIPLAQVAFNMLDQLEGFEDVFWAKLVQRVGGWAAPVVVPEKDVLYPSGSSDPELTNWPSETERTKAMGYQINAEGGTESSADYMARVAGVMRVYFCILRIRPERRPLGRVWQIGRCWMWVARLLGGPGGREGESKALMESAVGAQVLYSKLFLSVIEDELGLKLDIMQHC